MPPERYLERYCDIAISLRERAGVRKDRKRSKIPLGVWQVVTAAVTRIIVKMGVHSHWHVACSLINDKWFRGDMSFGFREEAFPGPNRSRPPSASTIGILRSYGAICVKHPCSLLMGLFCSHQALFWVHINPGDEELESIGYDLGLPR